MTPTRTKRGVIRCGTRVYSRVFPSMTGIVVRNWAGRGSYYRVKVDPEVGHFITHVLINEDEIVVGKPRSS